MQEEFVEFIEDGHKYILHKEDGTTKELMPVSTLLQHQQITPDYSALPSHILKTKAEYGRAVHSELENYVKTGEIGFTKELEVFIEKCKEYKITPFISEFIVHNDEIAGTVDVAGTVGDNGLAFIGDYKTTATLHYEAVQWQLSLYAYLHQDFIYEKFYCFHFPDSETCRVVDIVPIPFEEVEQLLKCEANCELYQRKTLELTEEQKEKIIAVHSELKLLKDRKKQLEEMENELNEFLIKKMEESGYRSVENDLFKITYVAPSTRETIDSTRLKKEQPEIAAQYIRTGVVKASVRITLRD